MFAISKARLTLLLLLLLRRFSRVRLCATPQMEAHQDVGILPQWVSKASEVKTTAIQKTKTWLMPRTEHTPH